MTLVFGLAAGALYADGLLGGAVVSVAAIDSQGFIYVAGSAWRDLPATPGVLQPVAPPDCTSIGPCQHGFVARIAPSGNRVVWATFWAGDGADSIAALAIAPDGSIVIAGSTTSKNLLPKLDGYQMNPASLFIAKLSADGKSVLAATYFGADGRDTIAALRLDRAGNIYVAGDADSAVFPTTPGAYQTKRGTAAPPPQYWANCDSMCTDQFVARFDPSLAKISFSTLFGTVIRESTGDLAVGLDGTLYLSGVRGPWGGQGPGATSSMLTRFSADASSVIYSVELGLVFDGGPVVADADGNAYVATSSPRWSVADSYSLTAKVDQLGTVLWSQPIPGPSVIRSMVLNSRSELVFTGLAGNTLRPTPGAPRLCTTYHSFPAVEAYVVRRNTADGAITYAGFLMADGSWLAGPDQVVAHSAYVGLPEYSVLPAANPPAGTVTCMASAAIYDRTAAAPGEIVSIFGTEIGPSRPFNTAFDANGNVSQELGGMTVTIGGLPAPMLYADPGQINLVAPYGMATSGEVPVEIRRSGSLIAAFLQPVSETHAALFTSDASGFGALATLNQDGSVNSVSNPASVGSVVSVFGTGFGVMTPAALDGATPCKAVGKPVTAFSFMVYGDGAGPSFSAPATVEYIGNAPCLVQGAVQINLRLPDTVKPLDGAITLAMFGSVSSGTIAVR
jgi:uncharacterized protein (TIGR03437 family)